MNATEIDLLLVEDSKLDARLIEERLRLASPGSVTVRHVMTLTEGVGQVAARRPDCILLDLHLPDGVGVENVEAMLEAADGTTLVVMTGLNDEATAIAALKLGAQEYLLKDQYDGPSRCGCCVMPLSGTVSSVSSMRSARSNTFTPATMY